MRWRGPRERNRSRCSLTWPLPNISPLVLLLPCLSRSDTNSGRGREEGGAAGNSTSVGDPVGAAHIEGSAGSIAVFEGSAAPQGSVTLGGDHGGSGGIDGGGAGHPSDHGGTGGGASSGGDRNNAAIDNNGGGVGADARGGGSGSDGSADNPNGTHGKAGTLNADNRGGGDGRGSLAGNSLGGGEGGGDGKDRLGEGQSPGGILGDAHSVPGDDSLVGIAGRAAGNEARNGSTSGNGRTSGSKHQLCGQKIQRINGPITKVTNIGCHRQAIDRLKSEQLGIIVSGQGGSATRAAQAVVESVGTHDFGKTSTTSGDSWAVRWSGLVERFRNQPLPRVVLVNASRVDYDVDTISPNVKTMVSDVVCKTVLMAAASRASVPRKPWALKEPWLRFVLPFFDSLLGYKFIHVTRDVRNIRNTHGDEVIVAAMAHRELTKDQIHNMVRQVKNVNATNGLSTALLAVNHVHAKHGGPAGKNKGQVRKYVKFAYAWGWMEQQIYDMFQWRKADSYMHISERHFNPNKPNRAKKSARKLAKFLGLPNATKDIIGKMTKVYKPPAKKDGHWHMMQTIVKLQGMERTRKALSTFGYKV